MSNHVTADPSPPSTPQSDALAALQATIGHTFATRQHLLDALTHRSYAYEFAAPGVVSNERLEFLGDAVLGL
ncbi:MAG: ribonuclease III, partial [Ktedonobacterales bacterium]